MTFFFLGSFGRDPSSDKVNKVLRDQLEQLKLCLLSTSPPRGGRISVVSRINPAFCGLPCPGPVDSGGTIFH